MILGNRERFAVEASISDEHSSDEDHARWVWGDCCYWIRGSACGDLERGGSLRVLANQFEAILEHAGNRDDVRLGDVPGDQLYAAIDAARYGVGSEEFDDQAPARPGRFDVAPAIDAFNHWKVFLVEDADRARIVWRHLDAHEVRHAALAPGEVDAALRQFLAWFHEAHPLPPTP